MSRRGTPDDVFGSGTGNSHHRSRSTASRSSSQSRTTSDSLLKSSHRTNSTTLTAPDEDGVRPSRAPSPSGGPRKLLKRGKSPGPAASTTTVASSSDREVPRPRPVSALEMRDLQQDKEHPSLTRSHLDTSEWDLAQRLELARRNSQNQAATEPTRRERAKAEREPALEETIYEGEKIVVFDIEL